MEGNQPIALWLLLAASWAIFAAGLGWLVWKWVQTVRCPTKKRKPGISRLLVFSFALIVSIWCLRLAVGAFGVWCPNPKDPSPALTGWEALLDSLVHALQTFSMDEDYTAYITEGRRMAAELTDNGGFVGFMGFYTAFLNVLAPVMGGAALFEILANVFPKIMIVATNFMWWRPRHYFSELNPGSLAFAASLLQEDYRWWRKPVLIFTDAYLDDESEKSTEMLLEAKMLGAICLKDDLSTVSKWGQGKRSFYLMDENEVENLRSLAELAGAENHNYIKNADIFLLTHNEAYTQMEKELCSRLREEFRFREDEMPRLLPVQSYRNLVTNLLVEVPLYEPVVAKYHENGEKPTELKVTILGSGLIGTEMFLAVYWMGQMLDCRLNITVVSKEAPEQFRKKIDFINPEILKTVDFGHTGKKDAVLRYNEDGDRAEHYATLRYYRSDIATSKPGISGGHYGIDGEQNCLEHPAVLDSDYIVVALGSDEDNIAVAEKLRLSVGNHHVEHAGEKKHTVIAYVVYNGDLCHTLNGKRYTCSCCKNQPDIYMYAFGSLQQVYSCDNIMLTRYQLMAEMAGEHYSRGQKNTDIRQETEKRVNSGRYEGKEQKDATNTYRYEDANYNYWANIARAMHLKYKVFSTGWICTSVFDDTTFDSGAHRSAVQQAVARYKRVALGFTDAEDGEAVAQLAARADRLAWLEHRRWNAYTRSRGYRSTDKYQTYGAFTGSHKHMDLKLHPCLVECDDPAVGVTGTDCLDLLGKALGKDFKKYDYPAREFGEYCLLTDAAKRMDMTEGRLAADCEAGKINGVFCLTDGRWVLPVNYVEKLEKEKVKDDVPTEAC